MVDDIYIYIYIYIYNSVLSELCSCLAGQERDLTTPSAYVVPLEDPRTVELHE